MVKNEIPACKGITLIDWYDSHAFKITTEWIEKNQKGFRKIDLADKFPF